MITKPVDALSQVVFIHDYLQLVFQFECFSVYNASEIVRGEDVLRFRHPGFCDALVALIGQHVTAVSTLAPSKLSLTFEDGSTFRILSGDDSARCAEAFTFSGPNNVLVVAHNA